MRPVRGVGWRPTEYTMPGVVLYRRAGFDPAKHPRDPGGPGGGQFVKALGGLGGAAAPTPPGALVNKRVTMAGVPPGDPLREKLNKRLATPQVKTRGADKGQVVRPAAPPYHRAVQQVRDAILAEIAAQHTLEMGRKWYPTERVHAERRAKAYGVSVEQAAGVMSATSPRCSYDINQRVTDEILDAAPRLHEAAHPLAEAGGGVMGTFRDDGVRIALGESIDQNLTGTKRRSFFNNMMWPGQTQDVTVDTWMFDAVAQGLGWTHDQAAHLGTEKTKDFPDSIGYMLASDATRQAAAQLGVAPDAAQAAYWIGRQQGLGLPNPSAQQGRTKRGRTRRDASRYGLPVPVGTVWGMNGLDPETLRRIEHVLATTLPVDGERPLSRAGPFKEGEHPRGPGGRWVVKYATYNSAGEYTDKEQELAGPFFHGGRAKLGPGGMIQPLVAPNTWGDTFDERGRSTHTYFSTDRETAASYARALGRRGRLFEVEPTVREVEYDPSGGNDSFKSRHPLKVVREVPPAEWDVQPGVSRAGYVESEHPRGKGGQWVSLGLEGMDDLLQGEFSPQRLEAKRVAHPRSGYMVEAGHSRRVSRPAEGTEGPATFDVRDHGDPRDPSYNSLAYMGGKSLGTEPIKHVYRGMSQAEWDQAQQRGYIESDRRGVIAEWEGTNASDDPRDAVSYLPRGPGVVAKIAVRPEDKWFTIRADSYLRTRQRVPVSRIEHAVEFRRGGKYDNEYEARPVRTS